MSGTADDGDIRESVRQRYAAAATLASSGDHDGARAEEDSSCCGVTVAGTTDELGRTVFGADLYGTVEADGAGGATLAASLG